MPLYDFQCLNCQNTFEEIISSDEYPSCPKCMSTKTQKELSAPSPLKTNPFPYKIGPVRPSAPSLNRNSCPASGSCGGGSGFS